MIDVARAQLKGDKDGRRIWGGPAAARGGRRARPVARGDARPRSTAAMRACIRRTGTSTRSSDARRPCWAYFDLEFTRKDGLNAIADGDAATNRVVSAACDRLMAAAGDRPLEIEVIVLASARPTKFSRHVVLRPHWTDGARRRRRSPARSTPAISRTS